MTDDFKQGYQKACVELLYLLTDHRVTDLEDSDLKNALIDHVQAMRAALSYNSSSTQTTALSDAPSAQINIPLDEELIYETSRHN